MAAWSLIYMKFTYMWYAYTYNYGNNNNFTLKDNIVLSLSDLKAGIMIVFVFLLEILLRIQYTFGTF